MTQGISEAASDWDAMRQFEALETDRDRQVQLFMTALAAARHARAARADIMELNAKVAIQNGRVGKLETRWIQGAAVIAFMLVVIPILLAVVSLVTR